MKSFSKSAAVLAGGLMFAGTASGATFSEDFEGDSSQWSNTTDGAAATFGTYGTGSNFSGSDHTAALGGTGGAFYGNSIANAGASTNAEELFSTAAVAIDAGHTQINVSAWLASWTGDGDLTVISISQYDAGDTQVGSTTAVLTGTGDAWEFQSGSVGVEAGATAYRVHYGNNGGNDNYADNISAESAVPEPGSLALLGLGGLALLRRRR